jgi:hypothetical protein
VRYHMDEICPLYTPDEPVGRPYGSLCAAKVRWHRGRRGACRIICARLPRRILAHLVAWSSNPDAPYEPL